MRAVIFLAISMLLWPVGQAQGAVEIRDVAMRDCVFVPDYRAINVGDRVRWTYDEGACTGVNHKIETYGDSAVTFESSPNCPSAQSNSSDCMNRSAPLQPKKETYEVTFSRQGSYNVFYYCPFHGTVSQGGTECSGMCGRVQVRGAQTSPSASASRSPSVRPTASKSASPTASASATVTVSPTTTVSPTASATATVLAETDEPREGGGGRGFIAVAAVAALAAAGFLVWRVFLAAR